MNKGRRIFDPKQETISTPKDSRILSQNNMESYLSDLHNQAKTLSVMKERKKQKAVDNVRLRKVSESRKNDLSILD